MDLGMRHCVFLDHAKKSTWKYKKSQLSAVLNLITFANNNYLVCIFRNGALMVIVLLCMCVCQWASFFLFQYKKMKEFDSLRPLCWIKFRLDQMNQHLGEKGGSAGDSVKDLSSQAAPLSTSMDLREKRNRMSRWRQIFPDLELWNLKTVKETTKP